MWVDSGSDTPYLVVVRRIDNPEKVESSRSGS